MEETTCESGEVGQSGRRPVLDLSRCSDCEACLDLCPEVFRRNPDTGRIEVVDLSAYPEAVIEEIVANCPRDCVEWEDDG